jgi:ABC-type antimicrobial peptide transport system permease subunit
MNYKLIAIPLGDLLKWDTSINEINRVAQATFNFDVSNFPISSITSQRVQIIYDWIMSLATKKINIDERNKLLVKFCKEIAGTKYVNQAVSKKRLRESYLMSAISRMRIPLLKILLL